MEDLGAKMDAGDPLMQQALLALRRYSEARGKKPAEEVQRLRLEAESLMAAVQEYQLRVLGGPVPSFR